MLTLEDLTSDAILTLYDAVEMRTRRLRKEKNLLEQLPYKAIDILVQDIFDASSGDDYTLDEKMEIDGKTLKPAERQKLHEVFHRDYGDIIGLLKECLTEENQEVFVQKLDDLYLKDRAAVGPE